MDTSMGVDDAEFWYGWVILTSCSIRANADGEVDRKYKAMKLGLLDVHKHNLPSKLALEYLSVIHHGVLCLELARPSPIS